ncbi:MAG: diguanylate cyclase [Candidatus Obscuribacterales bacterium]|nr:diguanylate cyclase [Candidatus Obscuribacterales bacterium]
MKEVQCVLIVDDQQAELTLVAEFLKSSGFSVTTATDGFKALAACKVRTPDVILLDLQMPLMSGLDVYNRLISDEKTKFIPIIFMRSEGQAAPQPGKESEDNPILVKPLEPQDVLSLVKTVLREKQLKDELRRKDVQVKELSLTDNLTSLRNARYLAEFLHTELSQCSRYNNYLSVLTVEVDNQKELLKLYGQKAADSLLSQLAVVLGRGLRRADLLARTGPFEFVLALPFTSADGAVEVAERARTNVEQSVFTFGDKTASVTVSVGVCQFRPEMDTEGTMLLSYARAAMTQARDDGGNQTFMAE